MCESNINFKVKQYGTTLADVWGASSNNEIHMNLLFPVAFYKEVT